MDFQYYPTPAALALRAWQKFKNRNFIRVLEPQAGTGELALAVESLEDYYRRRRPPIDCCELDATKHPVLREHDLNVVGVDFLEFGSGSIYSHCIMNPPFAEGAKHVCKAWDILWDGEIVAILNAETIRNQFSVERRRLGRLIEEFGDVEFISGAFVGPDVIREADVDVALVYLRKVADVKTDFIGNLFEELRTDNTDQEKLAEGYRNDALPAMPNSTIENLVLTFNAAVQAMRECVFAEARSAYYAGMLGETLPVREAGGSTAKDSSVEWVQTEVAKRYSKLKDRAWAGVLRSTNVTSRLSSAAQQRLESEFSEIKKLEFSLRNVYGFLCGLVEKQGDIQMEMVCDIFDLFTRYHSDNAVFHVGWKSNDKHRTCGMRLKTTRVILPGHGRDSFHSSLSGTSERLLQDFDKVFAMLDGKVAPENGLVDVFRRDFEYLRNGNRASSSYFDVRYYAGAGTIHFFPKSKDLVDRLNRLVGRHREWLPPESEHVSDSFWLQYEQAERFDKELRQEVASRARSRGDWGIYSNPLDYIARPDSHEDVEVQSAMELVGEACVAVLERNGISVDLAVGHSTPQQTTLLLEAA